MSVCKFIAADIPLHEVEPSKEYPLHIDLDKGKLIFGMVRINRYQAGRRFIV